MLLQVGDRPVDRFADAPLISADRPWRIAAAATARSAATRDASGGTHGLGSGAGLGAYPDCLVPGPFDDVGTLTLGVCERREDRVELGRQVARTVGGNACRSSAPGGC